MNVPTHTSWGKSKQTTLCAVCGGAAIHDPANGIGIAPSLILPASNNLSKAGHFTCQGDGLGEKEKEKESGNYYVKQSQEED